MKRILFSIYFFTFLGIGCLAQNQTATFYNNYEERIYLHTNSSFLLVGESLLFKAYCQNSSNNTPSELSTIAYIELIDENASAIVQAKIALTKGNGSGDFFLPSTLVSGNYTLIAYTQWMKNYPLPNFFRTQVTIINPFRKPANLVQKKKPTLQIEFSPEGGKLISGIDNTIGFVATNERMKGVNFNGKILDETGNAILEFTPRHNGKGRFSFTPAFGKEYKAVIIDSLQNIYFQILPSVVEEGIAMHVTENKNAFQINLVSHGIGKNAQTKMIAHHDESFFQLIDVQFANEQAQFEIKKASLPFGISQLTILNPKNEVVAERFIFNTSSSEDNIELQIERKKYQTRKKVSFTLAVKDTVLTHLSMSVRKVEKKVNQPFSLTDYLASDDGNNDKSILQKDRVDDQMLSWKTIPYSVENLVTKKTITPKYLPEVRNNLITGLVKRNDNKTASHEKVYLSIPSKSYLFFASLTDSTGRFYFNTDKIKFNTDVILQVNPSTCMDCEIKLDGNGLEDYTSFTPAALEIDSSFRKLIEQRSVLVQVENAYYSQKQDSILNKSEDTHFYGLPDKSYFLDAYVRFPTMEDILIEYIPEIILKKKGGQFEIKVMNLRKREAFGEDPLILLDGIPIFDSNQIMNYNPLLIEKIEIVGRRYFYGPIETQGIISFTAYDGTGKNISVSQKEKYLGIQPDKSYYSPTYNTSSSLDKIPDYRTQLYWNPNIIPSTKPQPFEFFTSDVSGDFEITVKGIRTDGKPIYHSTIIHVGNN